MKYGTFTVHKETALLSIPNVKCIRSKKAAKNASFPLNCTLTDFATDPAQIYPLKQIKSDLIDRGIHLYLYFDINLTNN